MSLNEGQRLGGLQTLLSVVVPIDTTLTERTPVLRLPGDSAPGRVYFEVADPGAGNLSNCVITVERDRSRTTGVQQFTIGSSGSGISPSLWAGPIIGGGSADFSGGVNVFAEELLPGGGVPATINCWVDYTEGIQTSHDRAPVVFNATIAAGPGTVQNWGAVPSGARWIQIICNQSTANLAATWRNSNGVGIANFNQWAQGAPVAVPAGFFLRTVNQSASSVNVGVVYT